MLQKHKNFSLENKINENYIYLQQVWAKCMKTNIQNHCLDFCLRTLQLPRYNPCDILLMWKLAPISPPSE